MIDETRRRLADMRAYARLTGRLLGERKLGDFLEDEQVRFAVYYALLVLGEASNSAPGPVRGQLPDVPWARLKGLRNRLVHAYFSIDAGTLYALVRRDMPQLLHTLEQAQIQEP